MQSQIELLNKQIKHLEPLVNNLLLEMGIVKSLNTFPSDTEIQAYSNLCNSDNCPQIIKDYEHYRIDLLYLRMFI